MQEYCCHEREQPNGRPTVHQQHIEKEEGQDDGDGNLVKPVHMFLEAEAEFISYQNSDEKQATK
ncbi:hypothetical protein VHA_002517 [Grimontia hollisae CIP 101886]|uniref:Uncharacterized protein n=1 Tax=Grimontia hollisae CIP 101886 TaxID=675812 RepID=D0I9I0_GRIHO|nr:hypothetical protein VHA_002517 [Grimontia hollisae CIP 101886]